MIFAEVSEARQSDESFLGESDYQNPQVAAIVSIPILGRTAKPPHFESLISRIGRAGYVSSIGTLMALEPPYRKSRIPHLSPEIARRFPRRRWRDCRLSRIHERLSIPTRETPTGTGPSGARVQSARLTPPADRRTNRAATASTPAAPRGRNPPSSCPRACL
jgi:hypothetical protein